MKKVKILAVLSTLFLAVNPKINAQQCNLQGVVKYKYNDYVGYKVDVGATVNFISKTDAENLNISNWNEYEDLSDDRITRKNNS